MEKIKILLSKSKICVILTNQYEILKSMGC